MKPRNVLVAYTVPNTREQKISLDAVKNALKKNRIMYDLADRDKLKDVQFRNRDLIIALGGDGTFLRAAQSVGKQLLLGVNADVQSKEGFFMKCSRHDFDEKIRKIINNDFEVKRLPRLEARIDNKRINSYALNEFFIGPKKSYHTAKYMIEVDGTKERHKSSGVIVTTPAGSNAWASTYAEKIPLESENFQVVVREPFERNVFKDYKLKHRVLGKGQKVKIISEMLDGVIVADSVSKEFEFKNGSRVVIGLSKNYLDAVWSI